MEAWIGLVGVFLGGVVALVGQQLSGRSQAKDRNATLLLEQLSTLVALSHDYRNRIWEERNNLSRNAAAKWHLSAYRMAQSRVRILVSDPELLGAVSELERLGIQLGRTWRLRRADSPDVEQAWQDHKKAVDNLTDLGRRLFTSRFPV
jgi:hypothetical protein